jgi:hypothetical protein
LEKGASEFLEMPPNTKAQKLVKYRISGIPLFLSAEVALPKG